MAEKFETQCACIKWHAPKPTQDYDIAGVKVCPASYVAVQQLVSRHKEAGKIIKRNETGFTSFVKELARKALAAESNSPPVVDETDEEAAAAS